MRAACGTIVYRYLSCVYRQKSTVSWEYLQYPYTYDLMRHSSGNDDTTIPTRPPGGLDEPPDTQHVHCARCGIDLFTAPRTPGNTGCPAWETHVVHHTITNHPDSKVHGANMGPIWGRQDPDGPHELCYLGHIARLWGRGMGYRLSDQSMIYIVPLPLQSFM